MYDPNIGCVALHILIGIRVEPTSRYTTISPRPQRDSALSLTVLSHRLLHVLYRHILPECGRPGITVQQSSY